MPGVVVVLDHPHWKRIEMDPDTGVVKCGAGVDLFKLTNALAKAGLRGLAQIAGVPGTVGGAVRMNAGGAYGDIGGAVEQVELLSDAGEVYTRDRDDLEFGYRRSNIAAPVILTATFSLLPDDPTEVMRRVKEIWMHKKASQPISDRSAGCCWKNPDPVQHPAAEGRPAGMLVDQAGLKGHRIGAAEVSTRHANFIALDKDASGADDAVRLIEHVEKVVLDKFGVALERELVIWP